MSQMEMAETHNIVAAPAARRRRLNKRFGLALGLLLGLVALADGLVYPRGFGVNMAVLFLAVGLACLVLRRPGVSARALGVATGIFCLGLLPMVDNFGWLSLLSGLFGLAILALTAAGYLPRGAGRLVSLLLRFAALFLGRLVADLGLAAGSVQGKPLGRRAAGRLAVWIVPLVCAGIFLVLFADANPVLDRLLSGIDLSVLLAGIAPARVIWWLLVAVAIWPFLQPRLLRWRKWPPVAARPAGQVESLIFGHAAILRSLIVFNLLFALQSGMDIYYLWTGHALPEGMSYADYAHRGAYPLVLTALLAAGFVLAAMRPGGPGEASRPIRLLVFLWIGQNVLLVLSSLLRLELYVAHYLLTGLRLAAAIWMALVAIGLCLILARIAWRRSNLWLIHANLAALGVVLYGCSLVDFSDVIARYNVAHSREATGEGLPLDIGYFYDLGPSALPAIDLVLDAPDPGIRPETLAALRQARSALAERVVAPADWRTWTFRNQRLRDYLAAHGAVAPEGRTGDKSSDFGQKE